MALRDARKLGIPIGIVAVWGTLCVGPLAAQSVDVEVTTGYYRPLGSFDPASVYVVTLPSHPSQLAGLSFGGAVGLAVSDRVGVDGRVYTVGSSVPRAITPGGARGPTSVRITAWLLEGTYDVSPRSNRARVSVTAGGAVVQYGGDAYAPFGSPRSLGGELGARLLVPLGHDVSLAANVTTLWYTLRVGMASGGANASPLQAGRQRDVGIALGLRWRLRGK